MGLPRGVGVAIAWSAAAGAIISGAVSAGVGSAQGTVTLDLVGTAQQRIGFADARGVPRQGDRIGGGSKVTGDDTGISRPVCTRIGKGAICQVQIQLSRGTMSAQGLIPLAGADQTPIPITGGTGTYDGARGTASPRTLPRARRASTSRSFPERDPRSRPRLESRVGGHPRILQSRHRRARRDGGDGHPGAGPGGR